MLILTRRPGEAICIGDDIEILIKEVRRNHVRIGINAPKDIQIRRADTVSKNPSEEAPEASENAAPPSEPAESDTKPDNS